MKLQEIAKSKGFREVAEFVQHCQAVNRAAEARRECARLQRLGRVPKPKKRRE